MKYEFKISLPVYKVLYALFFSLIMVVVRRISSSNEIISALEPNVALLAGVFMADNYYKEFANDRIQVFYRYPLKHKFVSTLTRCLINWVYLVILVVISYGGYLVIYRPSNFTAFAVGTMFIETLVASSVSILFMGITSFSITNFTQNIGIGIGCTLVIWLCLTSSTAVRLPQILQLFLLEESINYPGIREPYYLSRFFYLLVTLILILLNAIALRKQPKYKKKGRVLGYGNKN